MFESEKLIQYLEERHGGPVEIDEVSELGGESSGPEALKQFGYGRPLLVAYRSGGQSFREVFHHVRRNEFGRERDADRVAAVWLDYQTFNKLERHAPAVDMLALEQDGALRSLAGARNLLLVTTYLPGEVYANDFLRLRDGGELRDLDLQRAEALAAYLARIHRVKEDDPGLWRRRLRDLLGHGEGIMGLTDSYPTNLPYVSADELRELEEMANRWRWRLKPLAHRLSQVHGDFHPFNILFGEGVEFNVLDRSRGAWGAPADDASCLSINYIFFSLQRSGRLASPFQELHDAFWRRYLQENPDEEMLRAIQPWFAWRALVLASPLWYPTLSDDQRRKLLAFARRVMESDVYDYENPNRYLELPA